MALKAGRVGLNKELVDEFGYLIGEAPSGEYYTKTQTDNKFETKTHVNNTFQKKTLEVPIELLSGSALTVESALQGLNEEKFNRADQNVLGAKNLLKNNSTSKTASGITFTVNADGSVSADGTASADATIAVNTDLTNDVIVSGKKYILSGCPSGGGESKYYIRLGWKANESDTWGSLVARDVGSGVEFTAPSSTYGFLIHIGIVSGQTVNNIEFKPMIRLATDTDDTFVPYAMTNKELTDELTLHDVELTLDDATNIALQNNKSVRQGNVVCVRTQINVKSEKTAGSIILKAKAKHTQYGGAVLIDTNSDNKYSIVAVEQITGVVSFICKTAIPVGWYAITYTWITA